MRKGFENLITILLVAILISGGIVAIYQGTKYYPCKIDWTAVEVASTIFLGIVTLNLTKRIAKNQEEIQQGQIKLAVFELRYNVYDCLKDLYIFAELLLEEDDLDKKILTENYAEWFYENCRKREMLISQLEKSSMLFSEDIDVKITLIKSNGTRLFLKLDEVYGKTVSADDISEIKECCKGIIEYYKDIEDELKKIISLKTV